MNDIVPFNFDDTPVRIEDRDGQPWFVLADVCRALDIRNVSDAADRLDDDEKDDIALTDAINRTQQTLVINESGLYQLVLRSRKESARRFKKWITADVLPAIRRTGSYGAAGSPALPRDPRQLLAYLQQQAGDMVALQDANEAMAPKAAAYDRIADANGAMTLTEAAKVLKTTRTSLIALLQNLKWIFRSGRDGRWQGHADKIAAGYVTSRMGRYTSPTDGVQKAVASVVLTPKGIARLAVIMNERTPNHEAQVLHG